MISAQRHLFDLPEDVSYLNGASRSPLMKHLAPFGQHGINEKLRPYDVPHDQWFEPAKTLKKNLAKLINCPDHNRIALHPSVSYGIATAAKNIPLKSGDEVLIVGEQFPSNYYSWHRLTQESGATLKVVHCQMDLENKGKIWNEKILDAIGPQTRVVAIGNIHWTDGTLFQLEEISKRVKEYSGLLIIDGSQTIGVMPFDIQKIKADAVFCVGYKWLMGLYGMGFSYFGEYFDNGVPLEENWMHRKGSEDFQQLVNYTSEYGPLATRYNVGESASFVLIPVLNAAIEQLLDWGIENIQSYCQTLSQEPIDALRDLGCVIADANDRSHHLFGIRFREAVDLKLLEAKFREKKVFVSLRGTAVRVAINVYNTPQDIEKLVSCIQESMRMKVR